MKDDYNITKIVDIKELHSILGSFSLATGFSTGLVEHCSKKMLVATGWQDICTKFHRANQESMAHCKSSNSKVLENLNRPGLIKIQECENGLIYGMTPIILRGNHLANLFSGQVFFKSPDLQRFRRQAALYGFDVETYLAAVKRIPVISEKRFRNILKFLAMLVTPIAQLGLYHLESNKKIKTLHGLLPICSQCKKIRDDKGYWEQLELYFEQHSGVYFSHGLCEECAQKLYGREDWFKKKGDT